jgi:cardiolipin hydrolase
MPEWTMTKEELEKILVQTLADYKFSRGERQAVQAALAAIPADDQLLAFLRHRVFEIARGELTDPQAKAMLNWLEEIVKVLLPAVTAAKPVTPRPTEAYFSPGNDCVQAICGLLRRSMRTTDICVFTLTDNRIADAIEAAHRRGVAVRIISDQEKAADPGSDIERLGSRGIAIRMDRTADHMHHKFAIFDGTILLTGSYNWTLSAATSNEENLIVSYESPLVRQFASAFEKLWRQLS